MMFPNLSSSIKFFGLAATLLPATVFACPPWDVSEKTGELVNTELDELSGMVASRRHPGLFWVHEDSGNPDALYLIDRAGEVVTTVALEVQTVDLEDIAYGPCGESSCLYVADIGDNAERRQSVTLLRFPEPDSDATSVVPETLEFTWEDGPRDSEGFFIDPRDGLAYLVEKSEARVSGVYALDLDAATPVASRVGEIATNETFIYPNMITAADISPDGSVIAFRSYLRVYSLCRGDGESVEDALGGALEETIPPPMKQAESLAFGLDGAEVWLTSEMLPTPLHRMYHAEAAPVGDMGVVDAGVEPADVGIDAGADVGDSPDATPGEDVGRSQTESGSEPEGCSSSSSPPPLSPFLLALVLLFVRRKKR